MKKIFFLLALLVLSCSKKEGTPLRVEIEGLRKGTLYLERYDSLWNTQVIDSAKAKGKGVFEFSPQMNNQIELLTLRLDNGSKTPQNLSFFMENAPVQIHTYNEAFELKATIKGSPSQELFQEYQRNIRRFALNNTDLVAQSLKAAQQGALTTDSIAKAIDKNTLKMYLYVINFAFSHANSPVAAYAALSEAQVLQPKYLDSIYKKLTPEVKAHPYGQMLGETLKTIQQ